MKNISADASHHLLALTVSVANKTCFIYLQVESGYEALVEFYSVQDGSSNYWAQKLAPVLLHQVVRDVWKSVSDLESKETDSCCLKIEYNL